MKKKILAFMFAFCLLVSLQPISLANGNVVDSGKWGDNLRWQVTNDGVLTISGKGEMASADEFYPWHTPENFENYTTVILEEGVTSIAANAFSRFFGSSVTQVFLPSTIEAIGSGAFTKAGGMEKVHIPSIKDWLEIDMPEVGFGSPFSEMSCVTLYIDGAPANHIVIPDGTTAIGHAQFRCFRTMTSISIPNTVTRVEDYAFSNNFGERDSALTEITFPESVEYIGYAALALNRNIEKITILNPDCELGDILMDEFGHQFYGTCTVYGYAGSTAEKFAGERNLPFVALEENPAPAPSISFSDVKAGAWYEKTIVAAAGAGIIAGNADGTYNPGGQLTWAQTLVFAVRLDQFNRGEHIYGATDQGSPWYQIYVDYALERGIIAQQPAELNAPINRADAATVFSRVLGDREPVNSIPNDYFSDVLLSDIDGEDDELRYAAIYTLARYGIVNGMGDGSFGVSENFTRAQVATIVARMAGLAELVVIE